MFVKQLISLFTCLFIFVSCSKKDTQNKGCIFPDVVPLQTYFNPVWHPNGNLLGFNYTPLSGIGSNGKSPCIWYSYVGKSDSTGFYIMNKDGSGLKRLTNYPLYYPAWSPDGNWIAFMSQDNIYKLRFTGTELDTANIVQLTTRRSYNPSWTKNSDSIYFDSPNNELDGTGFYTIWKMSSEGEGKTRLIDATNHGDIREPFVGTDNKVYFTKYVNSNTEIFQMDKDGTSQIQYSRNGIDSRNPKLLNGKIYFESYGVWKVNSLGNTAIKLSSSSVTYDISLFGEIVYSKMDYDITKYNNQNGTLWIMNSDGSNNRQLTFNYSY